jgi:hypothetical protein
MGKQEKYQAKEDNRDVFDKALDGAMIIVPPTLIGALAGRAMGRRMAKKDLASYNDPKDKSWAEAGRKQFGREAFKKGSKKIIDEDGRMYGVLGGLTGANFGVASYQLREASKGKRRK